ncbi:MAG: ACP S-malonyltransferase [Bdellovibrionales bacterium]|nr:ACP S-malonyltransferase [Bdellovibrionales bacterium]
MRIGGLFPGQGSQQVGMGRELADANSEARDVFAEADRSLGFALSKLCFEGPLEELTLTQNSQPAILSTSYACFVAAGIQIHSAAGHSLGEYTALVSAGVLSFGDAVSLVHKRGRYMQEAVPVGEGKMLAVMGPSEEEIQAVIESIEEGVCEIANLNSPGQTVVAGDAQGVEAFSQAMKGGKLIPLNVSAPFHCRLMTPAAAKLAADLDATTFNEPAFPVYANVTAQPVTSGSDARELLKRQVCGTVRWTDSMLAMVAGEKLSHCVEFGPGGVLTKLLKRITNDVQRLEVYDTGSIDKVKAALES